MFNYLEVALSEINLQTETRLNAISNKLLNNYAICI